MNKYNYSKIYKIVCLKTNKAYYGVTTKRLSKVISLYQSYYRAYLKGKYDYITVFEIIKNEHYKTILLEHYKCENREQLNQRLKTYIDANPEESINKNRFLNKEQMKEYQANRYQLNKEYYKQYQRQYYQLNKEYYKQLRMHYRKLKEETLSKKIL